MKYQKLYGNKWTRIGTHLHGRTGYSIRNRYNFLKKNVDKEFQKLKNQNQRKLKNRKFYGQLFNLSHNLEHEGESVRVVHEMNFSTASVPTSGICKFIKDSNMI